MGENIEKGFLILVLMLTQIDHLDNRSLRKPHRLLPADAFVGSEYR